MSKKFSVKKQSSFIVAALAVGVSGSAVAAGDNPFQMQELAGGYQVAHQDEKSAARGKHEDDNSGKKDDHSKDGHSDDHDHEKGAAEGKCGAKHMKSNEGKCGGSM
ncbi:MAG TPA: hypothetical protein ENJ80_07500 [Gammaproteobacteria bacterium]|nr:hypothetical protein [Gammaproteobacteria bacterium]